MAAVYSLYVLINIVVAGSVTDWKLWTIVLSLTGPAPEDNSVFSSDPEIVVDIYS